MDSPSPDRPGRTLRSKVSVRKMHKALFPDSARNRQLAILLQDWDDPYNVGGMFRVADACGATELILTGKTPVPPHPQIHVTSLGHHRRVPWRQIGRYDDACRKLKEEGYHLLAVEIAEQAVHYMEYPYPDKVCLVLGNEEKGIYSSVMKQVDGAVVIPMAGKGRSLNVHVAAAIIAFEMLLGGSGGD